MFTSCRGVGENMGNAEELLKSFLFADWSNLNVDFFFTWIERKYSLFAGLCTVPKLVRLLASLIWVTVFYSGLTFGTLSCAANIMGIKLTLGVTYRCCNLLSDMLKHFHWWVWDSVGVLSSQLSEQGPYFHVSQLKNSDTTIVKERAVPPPRGSMPSPLTPL